MMTDGLEAQREIDRLKAEILDLEDEVKQKDAAYRGGIQKRNELYVELEQLKSQPLQEDRKKALEVLEQCDFETLGEPDYCSPHEYIDRYRDTIRSALMQQPEQAWQDIETAPRDGTWILITVPYEVDNMVVASWNGDFWVYDEDYDNNFAFPTHWQPLPQAPKGE